MSSQQFSKLNFLSATERRFYTRKKPSHDRFNQDQCISKVVKVLNSSPTMRKINKLQVLKTEPSQNYSDDNDFNETQFIRKQIKAKIEMLLKKSDKKWKILFQSYEKLKSCSTTETFSIQQNNFFIMFSDLLKENIDEAKNTTQMAKNWAKQSTQNKKELINFQINLEKIKLMKENQILRKKCFQSSLSNIHRKTSAFQEFVNLPVTEEKQQKQKTQQSDSIVRLKLKINQLNQKIYFLENQNLKFKESLVISEDSLKLLKQDKESLSKKNNELKLQNENLCAELVNLKLENENAVLKIERWKAVISFQREEILSYETELSVIKNEYKDLMRKYKILVKKMNSMTSNNESSIGPTGFGVFRQSESLNAKYFENFREQLETFSKVRTIFNSKESENTFEKSNGFTEKSYSSSGNSDHYKSFLGEKETLSNTSAVKKLSRQHYAYFKPNFYNFVETYMDIHGIDQSNMEQLRGGGFDLSCEFLTTIRAILDCKFNDFLSQDFTKTSSLANFTYAWLSKYKINRKQKKVVPIKGDLDKQVIPNFFMNLMSQKLNYNWEIITFREFLMESLTLDELYFYLMTRNWILQGDLLDNISGVYQQIYYITMVEAVNVLQKFITDVNFRKKVEEYMRRFTVYVRKRPLIDVHFVLRILLEYYQSKKHQEFTNLGSLAELLSKQKVTTFTFESFLKIFQYNFNYLSMTQKLEIYRKCFSCSRGKINLEVILTVLSEEGYLCKEVKKMFCNDSITVTKDQTKAEDVPITFEQDLPQMMEFQQFFQRFYRESYEQVRPKMGLQSFERCMELVKDFDQTNIFQRIKYVFDICLSTMRKAFYTKSTFQINLEISLRDFLPILDETIGMLKRFSKITCEKNSIMDLMTYFKRESAAKKILRFYRKKRNQMHRNFIFGVKEQTMEENHKMQGLRKDFNFMIENLKDKFSSKKIPLNEQEV